MKKTWMVGIGLAVFLSMTVGCATVAKDFTASTTASVSPANGFAYTSTKNQENLKASGSINKDGTVAFTVETTATTPESAIAAASAANSQALALISKLLDQVLAAASKVPVK